MSETAGSSTPLAFHPVSDIHTEMLQSPYAFVLKEIAEPTPILVLAGDVAVPMGRYGRNLRDIADFFRACCARYETVLFVPGNHSFYSPSASHGYAYGRTLMRRLCAATGVTWLDNNVWTDSTGTRYIGATLWGEVPLGFDEDIYLELSYVISDFNKIYVPNIPSFPTNAEGKVPAGTEPSQEFIEACFEDIELPEIPVLLEEERRGPGPGSPAEQPAEAAAEVGEQAQPSAASDADADADDAASEAAEEEPEIRLPPYKGPRAVHASCRRLRPVDVTAIHSHQEAFIGRQIEAAMADDGVRHVVVVSHHPPTQHYANCISNPRVNSLLGGEDPGEDRTACLAGHMSGTTVHKLSEGRNAFPKPLVWVCGHTHTTGDHMMHTDADLDELVPMLERAFAERGERGENDTNTDTLAARDPTPDDVGFIPADREEMLDLGYMPVRLVENCRGYPKQTMNGYDAYKRVVPGEESPAAFNADACVASILDAASPLETEPAAETETAKSCGCCVI